MPPWAPAGPPLLHGSRDNLNWSMCAIAICPSPFSVPANCHTGVHRPCCPSAGQNAGQGPTYYFACIQEKNRLRSGTPFSRQISQSQVSTLTASKAVYSTFDAEQQMKREFADRNYTIKLALNIPKMPTAH